jgi:hypothetical protein
MALRLRGLQTLYRVALRQRLITSVCHKDVIGNVTALPR